MMSNSFDDSGFNDFLYWCWKNGFPLRREKVALANLIWRGMEVKELPLAEVKNRLADAIAESTADRHRFLELYAGFINENTVKFPEEELDHLKEIKRYKKRRKANIYFSTSVLILMMAIVISYLFNLPFNLLFLTIGGLLGLTLIAYFIRQDSFIEQKPHAPPAKKLASIISDRNRTDDQEKEPPFNFDPFIPELYYSLINRPKPQVVQGTFKPTSDINNLYKIDIPKTIKATVLNAGLVKVHYKPQKQEPSYLLLFDNALRNTHFLEWFSYIHQMLLNEGIQSMRFSFDYDLRFCRNSRGENIRLMDWFQDQRLIIFSRGECMIDVQQGRLFGWVNQVHELWRQKVLLTPKGISDWGYEEDLLKGAFFVAPGTMEGLIGGLDYLNLANPVFKDYYEQYLEQKDRYKYLNTYDIGVLISELPKRVFDWVCACALYPRLNWKMTLYLGNLLEELPKALINRENLTKLYQLKWFEQGEIPYKHRQLLIALLPPTTLVKLREGLLAMLESNQYIVPPNSFAYDEHQQLLLRNRHELTYPEDAERPYILSQLKILIEETGTDDQELIDYIESQS